jgi:Fur family ferric uptake transcriptional regulator
VAVPDTAARVEEIVGRLRERGGRMNTARHALLTALVQAGGHVTAEDLARAVRRTHPQVHESTVYRNLDTLEQLGVLTHLHLGHSPSVYHFADEHHHHLVCEGCDAVVELPERLFRPLARTVKARTGFELSLHHFALLGRCAACSDGA